jgi:hypothetical protein
LTSARAPKKSYAEAWPFLASDWRHLLSSLRTFGSSALPAFPSPCAVLLQISGAQFDPCGTRLNLQFGAQRFERDVPIDGYGFFIVFIS